jgi:hypothetical protein
MRWLALAALLVACGDSPDGGGAAGAAGGGAGASSGAGGAGGEFVPPLVACGGAKEGDRCAAEGETCGALACSECKKTCAGGRWSIECIEATCAAAAPVEASKCDPSCGPSSCGPYDVRSACGPARALAECTALGWSFAVACDADCRALDQPACQATAGCAWAAPCRGAAAGCFPFPLLLGGCEGAGAGACGDGQTCLELEVASDDIAAGNCAVGSVVVTACVPGP